MKNSEIWITSKQVKEILQICNTTLWKLKKKGVLRYNQISRKVCYFDKESVIAYQTGINASK